MKLLKNTFFAILTVLSISSCSSDDDGGSNEIRFGTGTGQVTVNGSDFTLDKGLILDYGQNLGEDTYNFDIELASGDLTIDQNLGPQGVGNYLYLELHSDQSSNLKNGTYTYGFDSVDLSLTDAELEVNYDFETGDSDEFYNVTDGTVELSRSGNTYTLNFDLEVNGSQSLTGSYVGTLGSVDATGF